MSPKRKIETVKKSLREQRHTLTRFMYNLSSLNNDELCTNVNNENIYPISINNKYKNITPLTIIHWNANSITNKISEFEKFIIQNIAPDIISLNETKVSEFRANRIFKFQDNQIINKSRCENKNGARGVAILIKKGINYIEIRNEKLMKLEAKAVNIFL
jgi:CRISPR/Cas system-associated protein Cas7 (RAMP superfamily)